uniref:Phosphatidylinositol-glycan biosynthesis class W protein n=1 Tax=Lygus hesperus TaxID=30085 RepID=A0A0K8T2V0_LYGHE
MENSDVSYKHFHEQYLSDLEGTSSWDVVFLLVTIVFVGFLALYSRCLVRYNRPTLCFAQDILTFVIPTILLVTVSNKYTLHCACLVMPCVVSVVAYEVFIRTSSVQTHKILNFKITWKHSPFVTHFKAIVSLISIICILAVDFTVFPLKYAKTESYGFSLMDTGVAFYIVANGLTVNIKRIDKAFKKAFISNLPILVLGFIRFATVEKIGYQKHTTEYGVHWNFFFTLAIVKFVGSLVIPFLSGRVGLAGLGLSVTHQVVLGTGVEAWVMSDAPRTNLISANREGITSLYGYLSLYLMSAELGQLLIFRSTPPTIKGRIRHGLKCMLPSVAVLTALQIFGDVIPPPSRRLANATYVAWMSAVCLLVIGISMIFEALIIDLPTAVHDQSRRREECNGVRSNFSK